ncbi:MAG: hypothetical protein CMB99_13375 [Flavobacteriaceae bacterium]|nr:hypothetical protein [Flavobacteriaceae bacterium]|tara:strand:+ start:156173 stop:156676 length:504 start_codon:yes stop_codon:yes gene_type:complete
MDNIAEEQIIKFLEGQQKVLKEQQEEIGEIKNTLSKLVKQNQNNSSNNINKEGTQDHNDILQKSIKIANYTIEVNKSINQTREYLDTFFAKFPSKLKYEFVLGEKIKWQLYVLVVVLGIVITTSTITYNKYSDKNDYKLAWKALLEAQSNEDYKNKLINFLNEFKED